MISKIEKKSTTYWKHGNHSGIVGYLAGENRNKQKKASLETINISSSDWSRR